MEVGGEGDYIPIATLSPPTVPNKPTVSVDVKQHSTNISTRMTSALRM